MTDPQRFRDLRGEGLERLLFESAVDDAPNPDARHKLLGALAAGSAGTFAASQAAAATAAGKAVATLGATGSAASLLVKGAVIAVLATGTGIAVMTVAKRPQPVALAPPAAKRLPSVAPPQPSAALSQSEAPSRPSATNDTPHGMSREPKPAPVAVDDVAEQRELLDQARGALSAGRASLALKALNQYEAVYGFGLLGHEETVLSIEARLALGRREAAEQRARHYLSQYPQGTQASTVTRLLQIAAPQSSETSTPDGGGVEGNPTQE